MATLCLSLEELPALIIVLNRMRSRIRVPT
jgi:hypothetical protein